MKIEKIRKKKNNIYEITLDNLSKINLYDDILLNYNLLSKKEIEKNLLEEIIKENNNLECYYQALKYLNLKLRSKKEIEKYLNKNYNKETVNKTIKRLEKEKYINDDLYLKAFINDRINLSTKGPLVIKKELKNLGIAENKVTNYLNLFNDEVWLNKIAKIIAKKKKSNHKLSGNILKEKIKQFLIKEGFSIDLINRGIENFDFTDDEEIIQKELQKEYNKLKNKGKEEDILLKVKYNLYKKGFSISKIEELLTCFEEN